MSKRLTKLEQTQLGACESRIEKGIRSVGENLLEIRDKRLYRSNHDTFEDYCQDRWGFKRSYANKLIAAGKVAANLGTTGTQTDIPNNERHLREIGKAPEEKQVEVLETANANASAENRNPTARDFAEARETVMADSFDTDEYEDADDTGTKPEPPPKSGAPVVREPWKQIAQKAINETGALMRRIDRLADSIGDRGDNFKLAHGSLGDVLKAIRGMEKGKA